MEAKSAVEPLDIESIVFLPSPSSSITVSVFCMTHTIQSFLALYPCINFLVSAPEPVLCMQYDALEKHRFVDIRNG
jgi:hypothetical protein